MRTHNNWKTLKLKKKKLSSQWKVSFQPRILETFLLFFPLLILKTDFENEESTCLSLNAESHKQENKLFPSFQQTKHVFQLRPVLENVLIFLKVS